MPCSLPYAFSQLSSTLTNAEYFASSSHWQDPPDYWQNIVWPSYLYAHSSLFLDGDVEHGKIDPSVAENIVLLEANELGMEEMVEKACKAIFKAVRVREGLE